MALVDCDEDVPEDWNIFICLTAYLNRTLTAYLEYSWEVLYCTIFKSLAVEDFPLKWETRFFFFTDTVDYVFNCGTFILT